MIEPPINRPDSFNPGDRVSYIGPPISDSFGTLLAGEEGIVVDVEPLGRSDIWELVVSWVQYGTCVIPINRVNKFSN